jgi:hypothetical protein
MAVQWHHNHRLFIDNALSDFDAVRFSASKRLSEKSGTEKNLLQTAEKA